MIRIVDFCKSHKIDSTFIEQLSESGLIQLTTSEGESYLQEEELLPLEQFTYWYYDLEINLEGIEVAHRLLSRVKTLQREIYELKKTY